MPWAENGGGTPVKKQRTHMPSSKQKLHKILKTRTTMYDLIKVLNEVVKKEEKDFVPFIVLHMVDQGLLKTVDPPVSAGKSATGWPVRVH